jgi:hypothetical protein
MFHGVSLWNFHQGRNLWKWAEAKVWSFVVYLRTNFLCVLIIICLSTGCEEPQNKAVLSQGIFYLRVRGRSPCGRQTLAAHLRRSIPRALVAGLGTLDYGCEPAV